MYRTQEGWIEEYQNRGALWIHDGDVLRPHALLTSGKHSNGFFNSEIVMEDPMLLDRAAEDLVEKLWKLVDYRQSSIQCVIGPAMGAITLAHDVARNISGRYQHTPCRRAYAEVEGHRIISLIEREMPIWEAGDCPLCLKGSEAIRPKGENWARLNAEY